ncbi:MAG: M56 family metallopeptidase [Lachnospiraceae bacterium]
MGKKKGRLGMEVIRAIFDTIVYMSAGAAICVMAVLGLRVILGKLKMPKQYVCLLWLLVLYRLLCPFVPESSRFGVAVNLPWLEEAEETEESYKDEDRSAAGGADYIALTAGETEAIAVGAEAEQTKMENTQEMNSPADNDAWSAEETNIGNGGEPGATGIENGEERKDFGSIADAGAYNLYGEQQAAHGENDSLKLMDILAMLWMSGTLAGAILLFAQYRRIKRSLCTAVRIEENIWQCEGLRTPMVFGIWKPRIYLPLHLRESLSEGSYEAVLLHEQTHIRRRDYLFRILMTCALCLHWFNPLVWLAWHFYAKDQEMACDEYVLEKSDKCGRKEYSACLLEFSVKQSGIRIPLSFGESNTESRIKNILRYKRPAVWLSILAVMVLAVSVVLLAVNCVNEPAVSANGQEETAQDGTEQGVVAQSETIPEETLAGPEDGMDSTGAATVPEEITLWQPGEDFGEGIYITYETYSSDLQNAVFRWLETELEGDAGISYADMQCGRIFRDDSYNPGRIAYTMTFFLVHDGAPAEGIADTDRIFTTVCRVDFTAGIADSAQRIYQVGDITYSVSGEIEDKETFSYYFLPSGVYTETVLDYTFPQTTDYMGPFIEDNRDMTWARRLEELPMGSLSWMQAEYTRLQNPDSACEELLNLRGGTGEIVLQDKTFGTFVKYTFGDGSTLYLRMYKGGINRYYPYEEYPVTYERQVEALSDIYLSCRYYTEDTMQEILDMYAKAQALSLEQLKSITEIAIIYDYERADEWFLIAEDAEQDVAVYGDGADALTVVRIGEEYQVFPESWSGMRGSGMEVEARDYDRDGETEVLYKVYLGTGTGFSVDYLFAVDKDSEGVYRLYEYDWREYAAAFAERVDSSYDADAGQITVIIDGREQEPKITFDGEEQALTFSSLAIGDIIAFEPSGDVDGSWNLIATVGLSVEEWATPQYQESPVQIQARITYEGDGRFSLGEIIYLPPVE